VFAYSLAVAMLNEVINYNIVHKSTVLNLVFPPDITNLIGTFIEEDEFYEDYFEPIEDWSKKFWYPSDYYNNENINFDFDTIELQYGPPDYSIDVPDVPALFEYDNKNDDDYYIDNDDDDDDIYYYKCKE
jgi:hypothetical protein